VAEVTPDSALKVLIWPQLLDLSSAAIGIAAARCGKSRIVPFVLGCSEPPVHKDLSRGVLAAA